MPTNPHRAFALEVVERLQAAGHVALWAGGCVRDQLLGHDPVDYDVATDAPPERVVALFRRTVPVGIAFGVVRVLAPAASGAKEVEVATFRSDGAYIDGRRPESVAFGDARGDAERRDFTINGMFFDPTRNEAIDYVGGRADLDARILRAIGDPTARFAEDKLRLLRAVRFAARFDLAIDPATRDAIAAMADQIGVVSAERIGQELRRMLTHPTRARALTLARESGLIAAILPPVASLPAEDWDRTIRVLGHLPAEPTVPLAIAAACHRLGSAGVIEQLARDLKLSNAERERIGWLVAHQADLDHPRDLRPSRLKRLLAEPGADELIALARAIALGTTGDLAAVEHVEAYRRDLPDGPLRPAPLVTGHDVARSGLKPGPGFRTLLDRVYDAQLDNEVITKDDAIAWLARAIAAGRGGGQTDQD